MCNATVLIFMLAILFINFDKGHILGKDVNTFENLLDLRRYKTSVKKYSL